MLLYYYPSGYQFLQALGKVHTVALGGERKGPAVKTGTGVPSQHKEHLELGPGVAINPYKLEEPHPPSFPPTQRPNYRARNPWLVNTFFKTI